jgi:hypothetical protein
LATLEDSTATRTDRRLSSISVNPIDYKFFRARLDESCAITPPVLFLDRRLVRKTRHLNALRDPVGARPQQTLSD